MSPVCGILNVNVLYIHFFFVRTFFFHKFFCSEFPVEVVPRKKTDYQVPDQIHSKAGALKYIIMEIPLWPSVAENVLICIFCGILIITFSLALGIRKMFCGTSSTIFADL